MFFYQSTVSTIPNILSKHSECQTREFLGDKEPLYAEHACVLLSVQRRFFSAALCLLFRHATVNLTINSLILLHSTISPLQLVKITEMYM